MKIDKQRLTEESGLTIVFELGGKFYAPIVERDKLYAVRSVIAHVVSDLVEVEMNIKLKNGESK